MERQDNLHDNRVRANLNAAARPPKLDVDTKARLYVEQNPDVWAQFQRFTHEALNAGCKKLGAQLVAERIRWEAAVTKKADGFKINNSHLAFMARKFMAENPIFGDVFTTRKTEKEKANANGNQQ